MDGQPAIILRHTSSPRVELHDPRDPPVHDKYDDVLTRSEGAVLHPAPQHASADRAETEADRELLAVTDGLTVLIQKHGAARVMRLVRMLANLAGQEV